MVPNYAMAIEEQSLPISEKKKENVDGDVDSLIKNEIKTEIKEEYVEPTSSSQVKLEPLQIKTEDLKEEYIETEVPDFQQPLRTEGDQIIPEPEDAALTTTCEQCERKFDDVGGLEKHLKNHHRAEKSIECPHCDETFLKQAGLDYHVQVNHPNEAKNKQAPVLVPLRQTESYLNKKNENEKAGKKGGWSRAS